MYALLITAALAIVPVNDVLRDACDVIELNNHYDFDGRLLFQQVIFYEWTASDERYNVRDWRLVKTPDILPQRDFARGGWLCLWIEEQRTRSVSAPSIRETWTQVGLTGDPELNEREYLPQERRRKLKAER